MVDNIFKSNAFLAALKQKGGISYSNGGERIAIPLMYETNSTAKSYSGYDVIDVTPQDGMTTAFYPYSEVAATISISRREERQNNGEAAILGLLEQKIKQAEMSLKSAINAQLIRGTISSSTATYIPGNDEKDLIPLGMFSRSAPNTEPTSTLNVGNISSATYSWWKPIVGNAAASIATGHKWGLAITTYKGFLLGLRKQYNFCANGADGSAPNLIVSTQGTYELYCNAIMNQVQYQDVKLAEIGFDSVKLRGATMIYDERCPDMYTGTTTDSTAPVVGTAFFLNTNFYKLTIDRETDFVTTPFIEPENQTAKTAKILFMGQATCSNLRKIGHIQHIDETIAA